MSSATLTNARRPDGRSRDASRHTPQAAADDTSFATAGSFFVVAGLVVAAVAAVVLRGRPAAVLGVIAFTLVAAGIVGLALFRVLYPLAQTHHEPGPLPVGRARIALERDKALTLRAIKELEFDRAMGKVSDADFADMRDRLRQRALRLIRQLEGGAIYRQRIEADLGERRSAGPPAAPVAGQCMECGTVNDLDARFCKRCGEPLTADVESAGEGGSGGR